MTRAEGVLFVLGSQQIEQLELSNEIKSSLKEKTPVSRTINMDQLSKKSTWAIVKGAIDNFALDSELIDKIFEKSAGHPLALNYILNKVMSCTSLESINGAINSLLPYEGNIETQYEGYWQTLKSETSVLELLSFLSRIRGNIEKDVIKKLANNEDIARLIKVAGHYFRSVSSTKLGFFHNSFRQFILEKTGRDAFDVSDEKKHQEYHSKLADIALHQPPESHFKWELLYHIFHSGNDKKVLEIGQQSCFRNQFLSGRCFEAILEDLDLVMKAAKSCKCPLAVIRVLLINEELSSRDYILDERDFSQLLLKLGKTDEALSYVIKDGKLLLRKYKALKFSKLLYDLGNRDLAREIFDLAEPIEKIEGTRHHYDLYAGEEILDQWIESAVRFRPIKELANLISQFEADEIRRRPSVSLQETNQSLRDHYYRILIDSVVSSENLKIIESLPTEMKGYVPKEQILERIAWGVLYSGTNDSERKEKYFNFLMNDIGIAQFSNSEKILCCELLIKKKQNIEQAKEIFKTTDVPVKLDENVYLPDPATQSYYMKLFRYHRINSALGISKNPDEAVLPNNNSAHRYVVSVAKQVIALANCWGCSWKDNSSTVEEFIEMVKPALSLYENSQRPNADREIKDAIGIFAKRYMEIIIHTAITLGIDHLEALEGLFQCKWKDTKTSTLWSPWIRRTVSQILFECGLYQNNFADIIQNLDKEDPMLTPEGELRDFLEACEEKALDLYELGQEEKAYAYIEKMRKESFGVAHEKDTQINAWVNLFANILKEKPEAVKKDIIKFTNGVSTNAKYNRARYSSEGAIGLLSSIAMYNANCAQKLYKYFWENYVLEFPPTVEACITAAAESTNQDLAVVVALYRWLYLPYERYANLDPIKIISNKLCSYEKREEAINLLNYLKNAINQDVSEHTRGKYWSGFMEIFESISNQEDLLNEIRPCIRTSKTEN